MQSDPLLDCAGRRRSPATLTSFHVGRPPRNKGLRYPPDPPTVEEIIAVMSAAGNDPDGLRLRAVIVVLWRAGLRISEALSLVETDLDRPRGAILVRRGKGGKRREVGMDRWAWERLDTWLTYRATLPVGSCSASYVDRHAGGRVHPPICAPSYVAPPRQPGCVVGSHPINSVTRTLLKCRVRASRSSLSSVSSGTPVLGSPPRTYAGSTTPRSSTLSTNARHP